uniref:Uncharacterized protein n=1 Tax=Branchiostoma floridae TaxID=7739 RepID=C3Z306_BRAFL|eukprot:XP_002597033.1 hypothetical protein BRAFLDRAFT_96183 [Branchiostoma floridae]
MYLLWRDETSPETDRSVHETVPHHPPQRRQSEGVHERIHDGRQPQDDKKHEPKLQIDAYADQTFPAIVDGDQYCHLPPQKQKPGDKEYDYNDENASCLFLCGDDVLLVHMDAPDMLLMVPVRSYVQPSPERHEDTGVREHHHDNPCRTQNRHEHDEAPLYSAEEAPIVAGVRPFTVPSHHRGEAEQSGGHPSSCHRHQYVPAAHGAVVENGVLDGNIPVHGQKYQPGQR